MLGLEALQQRRKGHHVQKKMEEAHVDQRVRIESVHYSTVSTSA